jgi:hypothetical protein
MNKGKSKEMTVTTMVKVIRIVFLLANSHFPWIFLQKFDFFFRYAHNDAIIHSLTLDVGLF